MPVGKLCFWLCAEAFVVVMAFMKMQINNAFVKILFNKIILQNKARLQYFFERKKVLTGDEDLLTFLFTRQHIHHRFRLQQTFIIFFFRIAAKCNGTAGLKRKIAVACVV